MADTEIASELKSQIPKALRSLQEYDGQKHEKKLPLFPDQKKNVLLTIKYKKPFFKTTGRQCTFVKLPYSDRNPSNTSVCLILPDFDHSSKALTDPDVDKQAKEWEEILREKYGLICGVNYTKIFTFIQLKREYTDVKDRARLANTYDIFFVDYKLAKKVEYFMGKLFKKPAHRPILIKSEQNFSQKIEEAYNQTLILFMPMNDALSIRIGNLNQKLKHLKLNSFAILDSLLQHFPGGEINIRSCYIQTLEVSLPVFVDFGSPNEVKFDLPEDPELVEIIGDCSTLPEGLQVKVRADGNVTTLEESTGKEIFYPTEKDEFERNDDIKPLNNELLKKILSKKGKVVTKIEQIKNEINKVKKEEEEEEKKKNNNNNNKNDDKVQILKENEEKEKEENEEKKEKEENKIKKKKRKIIEEEEDEENNNKNLMMIKKRKKLSKKKKNKSSSKI